MWPSSTKAAAPYSAWGRVPTTWAEWVAGSISWMAAVAVTALPGTAPVWPPKAKMVGAERDDRGVAHRHLEVGGRW